MHRREFIESLGDILIGHPGCEGSEFEVTASARITNFSEEERAAITLALREALQYFSPEKVILGLVTGSAVLSVKCMHIVDNIMERDDVVYALTRAYGEWKRHHTPSRLVLVKIECKLSFVTTVVSHTGN